MNDDKNKPDDTSKPQPLSSKLAAICGLVGALIAVLAIGPWLIPLEPGQNFNVSRMLCAAAGGAIGALVGYLLGALIEGPKKKE